MADRAPAWRTEPERGSTAGLRLMRWLAHYAPDWVLTPLIRVIAIYYAVFSAQTTRDGLAAYLGRLEGRKPRFGDRLRQIETFAHVMLERVRLLSRGLDGYTVTPTGGEIVEKHHLAGRGGIFLGAHFGSFEVLRTFDRTLPGLKVRYLMFSDNAEKSTQLLDAINPDVKAQVIPLVDGHAAMLAAREAIAEGSFVAFLGDRMPSMLDRASIDVDFLGDPVGFPRAPYLIAMLAEAPVILCFGARTGRRRYEITFSELYDGTAVPRAERETRCGELAQGYADALAGMCRAHPHNWFNFYDVWR